MATSTIKSSGGDYTSLSAWEADKQADITGLGPEIAECYDLDDTTDVGISGWTTTATDYIEIKAATAARCDGSTRAQTGNTYRLSSAASGVLRIDQNHVRVSGIEIKCTGDGIAIQTISSASGSDVRFEDCVISSNGASASTAYTCLVTTANLNLTLRNCIITGKRRALDCRNSASVTIDHCTIYTDAAALGVVADSELTCTNTYSGGHSSEDFWTGGAAPSGSHNASSDTSASTDYTSSLTSKSATNQFTSPSISDSTMDFTLKATADLVDNGTGSYATDIAGNTRSGTVDIGAFEYISGGTTHEVAAAFSQNHGCSLTKTADYSASAAFSQSFSMSQGGAADFSTAAPFSQSFDAIVANVATLVAQAQTGITSSMVADSTAIINAGATVHTTYTTIAASGLTIQAAALIAVNHAMSAGQDVSIEALADFSVSCGLLCAAVNDATASADFAMVSGVVAETVAILNVQAQLGITSGVSVTRTFTTDAGISCSITSSFTASGAIQVIGSVTTPGSRTMTILAENRTLTISLENRTLTIEE